jgi:hypothetical protein
MPGCTSGRKESEVHRAEKQTVHVLAPVSLTKVNSLSIVV